MEFTQQEQLFQQVVTEAWENATFKAELMSNPLAAIEKLTGKKLALTKGKTLVVRDQTAENNVYINIPALPEVDAELNEEELEKVAGGCQHGDSGMNTHFPFTKPKNPLEDILELPTF